MARSSSLNKAFAELCNLDDFEAIMAIDFGTFGTGYAYAFIYKDKQEIGNVYHNRQWPDGTEGKTRTAILLDHDDNCIAFGKQAEKVSLATLAPHKYFEDFKMQLYDNRGEKVYIKDIHGNSTAAEIVISRVLKYLKEHFFESLIKRKTPMEEDKVKYVLTVPAIWSDSAKQLMRRAAALAKLAHVNDYHRLTFALEPEAASLWCLLNKDVVLKPKETYVVADCGGGTIDVTVHQVTQDGQKIIEIAEASGGDNGSQVINRRIIENLKLMFGEHRFKNFKDDSAGWFNMQRDIEDNKVAFSGDGDVVLNIPDSLSARTKSFDLDPLEAVNAFNRDWGVDYILRGQSLIISRATFLKLVMASVQATVKHVLQVCSHAHGISKVLLVGSFANCGILYEELRSQLEAMNIALIVPDSPGTCVVKGAVLFGAKPQVKEISKSRKTYCVLTSGLFVKGTHIETERWKDVKGDMRVSLADKLVEKGQDIRAEEIVERSYPPTYDDQTAVRIKLLATDKINPLYASECKVVAELDIDLPMTGDRWVHYALKFSGSEIVAVATNSIGKQVNVQTNFMFH